MSAYAWLALMAALLILEGSTLGLHAIWFALGAMAAAILAALGLSAGIQIWAFLTVSVALLLILRPAAKKLITGGGKRTHATNIDRIYGMTGIVTEEIDNIGSKGAVYVDGKTWTARSYTGEPIPESTHISVNMIDGVKLVVSEIPQEKIYKEESL